MMYARWDPANFKGSMPWIAAMHVARPLARTEGGEMHRIYQSQLLREPQHRAFWT